MAVVASDVINHSTRPAAATAAGTASTELPYAGHAPVL